jgi:transcriptional regulator with XRE-family HTH domain
LVINRGVARQNAFDQKQEITMSTTPTPDLETARRLRLIRTSKGLSQREMARLAGVGSGTISQIESGSTQPSVALLKKILAGVDVNLGFFFSFELKNEDNFSTLTTACAIWGRTALLTCLSQETVEIVSCRC